MVILSHLFSLQQCLTDLYAHIQPNFTDFDEYIKTFSVAVTNLPIPPPGGDLSLTFKVILILCYIIIIYYNVIYICEGFSLR